MNAIEKLHNATADLELKSKFDQFQELINKKPQEKWIKKHPFIKEYYYLPIAEVENLIRTIFQEWEWKVNDFKVIANAICVHGTLKVKHPVTNQWYCYDGLGAVDIQTAKGSNPTDFNSIVSGAIQKNLPAAESFALKDAAEKLGELFGASLNRKDVVQMNNIYNTQTRWSKDQMNG
jgi:hypothetical protein